MRVPAKVNLQLSVGPKEADGFHNLVSVFQAISIFDDVTVTKSNPGSGVTITVSGEHTHGVPEDHSNLAVKAAQLIGEKFDFAVDVHIEIKKSIPVAGGMAGGSADAAGTLVAMDSLFQLEMSREELHALGSELGSDVPFMISGGTSIGQGRGDQLTAALSRGTYHWVLALSSVGLSTPAVYTECDRMRAELDIAPPQVSDALMQSLLAADPKAVGQALHNDLHEACSPVIDQLRNATRETVQVAVLDGREVVYVERRESPQTLRLFGRVGHRNDAHCTSTGKLLLAFLQVDINQRKFYA